MSLVPEDVQAEQLRLELRLKLLEAHDAARTNFFSYVRYMWPEAILGAHHKKMAEAFDRIANGTLKRLIINMPPRHRLEIETPIPTVNGWKTVDSVEVGDYVFSPNGTPVKVTGKSAEYVEEIYEVITSDGQTIQCDGEHLWTVRFGSGRPYETMSTVEILNKLNSESWRKLGNLPMLPPQNAAQYPYQELPIDPYVLGVWLGDGGSHGASIGCSFKDMQKMRAQVEDCGYETTHNPKFQQFNILGLHVKLRQLGLLKNKHIPEIYLCASVSQRMALLQGLIDTDGNVTKEGKVTFNQTNLKLTEQVLCLIHSLGNKARITQRQTSYKGKPSQPSHRIMFKSSSAARLPRKASRCRDMQGNWSRSIDIRPTNKIGKVRCLEVENEDGLFMAGRGWVVTHNTKSEFASFLLPSYLMGRDPRLQVIEATHTAELAVKFGRKVRDVMDTEEYAELFPAVKLKVDSKAAGRWDTSKGGSYFAVGVGGAVTGRGADLLIIDDPHSEQDAMSELALENAWEWYQGGPRTRLQPGGAIVLVMCMTGDTPVLMANGKEKPLRDIRSGDFVATFEKGRLTTSKINNWQSSGVDSIHQIQTQSGKILRANERHPFLVMNEGVLEWTRLNQLRVGDLLVSLKGAQGLRDHRLSQENVALAKQEIATTAKTQAHPTDLLGTTENGRGLSVAQMVVGKMSRAVGYVISTISKSTLQRKRQKTLANIELKAVTASPLSSMRRWFWSATTDVMCAARSLMIKTPALIGTESCALTTATTQGRSGGYCATTATLLSDTGKRQAYLNELHRISDFTVDPIVSITPDGQEEVFDVEVDRTENFIANGVVSHNTRWGTRDLTARLLKAQTSHHADRWEVIEFPAILPSGKPLWPEFWKLEELEAVRASLSVQKWNAMYQQQPTNDEGAILKREWWRRWEYDDSPPVDYMIQSYDTAYSKKETADFSVITTWGVFYPSADEGAHIILLAVKRGRWDFPELKRVALEEYKVWQPDNVLIEAKATGITLQQEMRRAGIPVTMYTPGGRRSGTDKVSRANSIAPLLESGMVWAPETVWADELIEECAAFPNGDHDDQVDSTTQALMRFRQGNFLQLPVDEAEDEVEEDGLVPEYY